MSEYTQQEQTEIVRDAMALTATILIEKDELAKLKKERFSEKPSAPPRKVLQVPQIQAQLPAPPKATLTFGGGTWGRSLAK